MDQNNVTNETIQAQGFNWDGSQRGGWIALFIMLIFWWLSFLPRAFAQYVIKDTEDPSKIKVGKCLNSNFSFQGCIELML